MIILLFDKNRVLFFSVINIDHSGLHLFIFDKFVFWEIPAGQFAYTTHMRSQSVLLCTSAHLSWLLELNVVELWRSQTDSLILSTAEDIFILPLLKAIFLFYCYKVSGSLYSAVKIEVGRAVVQDSAGSNVNRNKSKQKELSQLNLSQCYDEFDQKEK